MGCLYEYISKMNPLSVAPLFSPILWDKPRFCLTYMSSMLAVCYGKTEKEVINYREPKKERFKLKAGE